MAGKTAKAPKVKREKKVRVKGEPIPAIKWFVDKAEETGKDVDKIRAAAERQEYSPSTISIQLGRLRGMGLLPHLEAKPKTHSNGKKKLKKRATKAAKPRTFHPAPKPSQVAATA